MTHLSIGYDPILVIFSFLVAIIASSSALTCLNRMRTDPTYKTRWHLGGAFSFGLGVWTMHFVGMAALRLPILVGYNLPITAASVLFIFIGAWFAFSLVGVSNTSNGRIIGGGILLGIGVGAMHYTGMFSLRSSAEIGFDLPMVGVSALVAVVLSTIGLWLLNNNQFQNLPYRNLIVTVVVGLAVPLMHYTGMFASHFDLSTKASDSFAPISDGVVSLDLFLLFALVSVVAPLLVNAALPSRQTDELRAF